MKSILGPSRRPDITFFPSGRIDISARIARILSLARGDIIDIAARESELFLYVRHRAQLATGRHQARVWPTSRGHGTFRASSRTLARAVLNAARSPGPLRCPCGTEIQQNNQTYITIIYRNPL